MKRSGIFSISAFRRIERPGLDASRRRWSACREIDEQIRVTLQEPIEPTGRPFAAVGQDDRAFRCAASARSGPSRPHRQLVVDHDRHLELRGGVEDLPNTGLFGSRSISRRPTWRMWTSRSRALPRSSWSSS